MYCANQPKATVNYKFNGKDGRTFYTEQTPIEVKVIEKYVPDFIGGQCPIGYEVRFRYKTGAINAERTEIRQLQGAIQGAGMVGVFAEDVGYDRYSSDRTSGQFEYLLFIYHNNTRVQIAGGSGSFFSQPGFAPLRKDYYIFITSITPLNNQPDNCGNAKKICEMQVINDGRIIFSDQGQCPCEFSIQCGDCPSGTTRCECSGYPGYCCLPCNEIVREIKAITNQVRSLKNG